MNPIFDVAIIGGGINGCGIAADAALRGLSVILFEQDDIASKTSSSSSKLIHGGLRYLEHFEFKLVKKALEERQTLLEQAPYLVHPQALILPHQASIRPAWLLRAGLFLYDHLSKKNSLPHSQFIVREKNKAFEPLKKTINKGFIFYDAITDDARLTLANAMQARQHGASIKVREQVIKADIKEALWHLTIQPQTASPYSIVAKTLINASGPWVNHTNQRLKQASTKQITLVQGSHIVVPRQYEGNQAYFLQNTDKRMIFVLPFQDKTMIGTTEIILQDPINNPVISPEEVDYLIDVFNRHFNHSITAKEVIYSWSGIRALLAEDKKKASTLSRDYDLSVSYSPAPLMTVYGGKITTYRQLAQEAIDKLNIAFDHLPSSSTKNTPLPGARLHSMDFSTYCRYAKEKYHWLDKNILERYLNTYGTRSESFLSCCSDMKSLGKHFGATLYEAELRYLITDEWAMTAEDVLFRRTKLGLSISEEEKENIAEFMALHAPLNHSCATVYNESVELESH